MPTLSLKDSVSTFGAITVIRFTCLLPKATSLP